MKKQCQHCLICFDVKPSETGNFCSVYCYHAAMKNPHLEGSKFKYPQSPISFIQCKWCGGLFTRKGNKGEFCSVDCRKALANAKEYARNRNKHFKVKVKCSECGKEFIPIYGDKKRVFCSKKCCEKNGNRTSKIKREAAIRKVSVESVNPIKVFDRDNWVCQLCGHKVLRSKRGSYHPRSPELDHIIPISKGGEHSYRNTQCTCRQCNWSKGAGTKGQLRLF